MTEMSHGISAGQSNQSPFPPPPGFALTYTTDNVKNQRTLKPPPVPKKFTVFGEEINMEGKMIQSLPELGLQQMYSSNANWKSELKKLNKSVVAAFLDLLEILIKCPDHPERREKIETIRMLFINMHHLINEFRPVQARDTLRHMMTKQNKEIVNVTEKLRDYVATSNEAFDRVLNSFKGSEYDSCLPPAPDAYTNPPEFEKLSFNSKNNTLLTSKGATKHEFISQNMVMEKHLQFLQIADGEEKYDDSFSKFDFEEESSDSPPHPEERTEEEQLEEQLDFQLEEPDEFNKSSSSEHEREEQEMEDENTPAQVEFMDDEESDDADADLMDVVDDQSVSNMGIPQNKSNPISPSVGEFQELPAEFVDDQTASTSAQNQETPVVNFEEILEMDKQERSKSGTPEVPPERQQDEQ